MKPQTYKGNLIHPCERVKGEHQGRWVVLTHHGPTGMPYADEHCPHFSTLAEARDYITERAGHTGEF